MIGIGIDLCLTTFRVMIKEVGPTGTSFHHVTDGVRRQIPFRGCEQGAWGSMATKVGAELPTGRQVRVAVWRGLYKRLVDHLGGLEPDVGGGYGVAVACEDNSGGTRRADLPAELAAGGFGSCRVLGPADAVMALSLQTSREKLVADTVLAAVAVCEETVEVRAAKLNERGRVAELGQPNVIHGVGHAVWRDHLYSILASRFSEAPPQERSLAVEDSIVEMAKALSAAPPAAEIPWRGAAAEFLFSPLNISRIDMEEWPRAQSLKAALPEALRSAAQELGVARCSAVALGGVGAVWPFARDALVASRAALVEIGDPVDAVSMGAAGSDLEPFPDLSSVRSRPPQVSSEGAPLGR